MSAFGVAAGECRYPGCLKAQAPHPALPLCFIHQGAFAVAPEYGQWVACLMRGQPGHAATVLVNWLEAARSEQH